MHTPRTGQVALKNLGSQVKIARKRRFWTIADLASKVGVSSPTIISLEKGEPTVRVGVVVSALWALGLEKELMMLSKPTDDEGILLMNSRLPKRIRTKKRTLDNDF